MNRSEFINAAGGTYQKSKGWSWLKGRDKYKRFWKFYVDVHPRAKTVYGLLPVESVFHNNQYSIEHIVPISVLRNHLKGPVLQGASLNPFNLLPAHQRLNIERSNYNFDFDNDPIVTILPMLSKRNKSSQQSGFDAEHEWVPPARSRGDIARSVLYMKLVYPIKKLYIEHHEDLIRWCLHDQPSELEKAYNDWAYSKWKIQNPLIAEPSLLGDSGFLKLLSEDYPK